MYDVSGGVACAHRVGQWSVLEPNLYAAGDPFVLPLKLLESEEHISLWANGVVSFFLL